MNPTYFKINTLFSDYLNQKDSLRPFFMQPLHPDWSALARKVNKRFKNNDVIKELIKQNSTGKEQLVWDNLKLLEKNNTLLVVTGQQMGIFISPLYIVYKTLSTILLCEKLNREVNDFNFVPVFWLEGEDHDFEEVSGSNFPDRDGNLVNIKLSQSENEEGFSLNKKILPNEITGLVNQLKESFQQTEFSENLFHELFTIYQPGKNWLDAFREHLSVLFAETGLLFFNAGSPKIKELSRPFFKKVIVENKSLVSHFETKSQELEKAGYGNQVNIQKEKAYLFISYEDGPRLPLLRTEKGFYIKKIEKEFPLDQMLSMLDKHPGWFSSTVLTRPLWQSWLLPAVSYIAGGAEIAYWGQLHSAFAFLDLEMPQVQPRHTFTLIEPKISRLLSRYNIDVEKIENDRTSFVNAYFDQTQLVQVNEVFSDFEKNTINSREKVKQLISQIDPTLTNPAEKSYHSILQTIEKLHSRLIQRLKEKDEVTRNHLQMIHESILPGNVLQERVISAVYFQNKYGPGWLKNIREKIDENFQYHQIVEL